MKEISENILQDLYVTQEKSVCEMSIILNTYKNNIYNKLKELGIYENRKDKISKVNKDSIIKAYVEDKMSVAELCEKLGVSDWAAKSILYGAGVMRNRSEANKNFMSKGNHGSQYADINKESLFRMFIIERTSIDDISNFYGVKYNTILYRLEDLGLLGQMDSKVDQEKIIDLYSNNIKNVVDLSIEFGVSRSTIYNILYKVGIVRSLSESNKIKWENEYFRNKIVKRIIEMSHIRPTSGETITFEILKNINNNFVYNGDYSQKIVIDGKIPDFIDTNNKKVILFNGCHWHCCPECFPNRWINCIAIPSLVDIEDKENIRYKNKGYQYMVIWEHELHDLNAIGNKILQFCGCKEENEIV